MRRGAWSRAWADRGYRLQFLLTIPALVLTLNVLSRFLDGIEDRKGVILPDPVLTWFTPRDLTWLTFTLIYGGLLLALVALRRHPRRLLVALEAYILLAIARMALMYVAPLDPPPEIIPLRDPLVEWFGSGRTLTRDLFFSGHTATMFLLALVSPLPWLRLLLFVFTAAVAVLTVWPHTHYTVDVLAAPFLAYACYHLARFAVGDVPLRGAATSPARR
ncbi:MAG: phosphatase PAP2-related protein [Planctomycetota bacterium]